MTRTPRGTNSHRTYTPPGVVPPDQAKLLKDARARLKGPVEVGFFTRYQRAHTEWSVNDVELLVLAAQTRARLDAARAAVAKHGLLIKGERGNLVKNPILAVERSTSVELRSLLRLLRLSEAE